MDWTKLLSTRRLGKLKQTDGDQGDPRTDFTRDWDRIVFSSAFRRLQDKTQVFPLAKSDYVRTRLTHSLEVASVGRSLGMQAADVILRKQPDLKGRISAHDIGAIVSTACLAHDIGNPPFGHAGESAIQEWFMGNDRALEGLSEQEQQDLLKFEGNAQGFRSLATLQFFPQLGGMQLTSAVLGTFTKYPRASVVDAPQSTGISGKKFGFMHSEAELFQGLADELGLLKKAGSSMAWHRHPLAFLVEAADDTCYHIMDVEDGFKAGVVSFDELRSLYEPWLTDVQLAKADRYDNLQRRAEYFRALTVGEVIKEAIAVFDANYDGLMSGSFDDELSARFQRASHFKAFKDLAKKKVYSARPVIEVEACGFEVIGGLLDAFVNAVQVKAKGGSVGKVRSRTLLGLLPSGGAGATSSYEQLLVVTDYVSGMTDSFAVELYQKIRGISLP